jgi:hypothetical protein
VSKAGKYRSIFMQKNLHASVLQTTKHSIKMAESKALLFVLNMLWPPLYVFAWLTNLDNIKSTILFIVALIMGMIRFYFWVIRATQNRRLKDLDIEEREKEISKQ